MKTMKYWVVNSEDQVIRLLQLGTVSQSLAAAKVKHLYGKNSCFLKVEAITEKMYKIAKDMGIKG